MNCPSCNSNDWKNVDEFRFKQKDDKGHDIGMHICNVCSFISYPAKYKSKAEIIAHYRKEYRKPPTVMNMFTGQRKNHFHYAFLKDHIEKWQKSEDQIDIVEIGAAFGMSLNMFQQLLPGANIEGTELTQSYKNVCKQEFGIELKDDFDDSKSYDLIMSYKVLEHQLDPHVELARYAKALKPEGFLYISVPTWFGPMVNFGLEGFDLEYYYDPNHINVWTRQMFESMMSRAGLEIVKYDGTMYGDTYLCKRTIKAVTTEPFIEKPGHILEKLKATKEAFLAFIDQDYAGAIAHYKNFPQAHINLLEMSRKELSEKGWEAFKRDRIDSMLDSCPDSVEAMICATDFMMRMKRYEEALEMTKTTLKLKPNNPASLFQAGICFEQSAVLSKDKNEKLKFLLKAKELYFHLMNVSEQNKHETISKIYFINSQIPSDSVEMAQVK